MLLLVMVAASALAGCAPLPGGGTSASFIETSFTVNPGEKHTVSVVLRAQHTVDGLVTVSGQENTIDFYINDPDGGLVYGNVRIVGGQSFEVRAQKDGTYTLYFDNSISFGLPREIALRYRVR